MATLKFYFDDRRTKNEGSGLVKILVSEKSKQTLLSLGITLSSELWNKEKNCLNDMSGQFKKLDALLKNYMLVAQQTLLEFQMAGIQFTAFELKAAIVKKLFPDRDQRKEDAKPKVPKDSLKAVFERWMATKNEGRLTW